MYLLILIPTIILAILLFKFKTTKTMKIYITAMMALVFTILIILYPQQSYQSGLDGLKMWFNVVFPALFPFFVGSEILINLGLVNFIGIFLQPLMAPLFNVPGSGSFVFAMSVTSGYPMGAKLTSRLRQDKVITKIQGERLLSFCNTSGPLFVIGAVGVGMFNSTKVGIIILISHYLACITTGIIFRFYKYQKDSCKSIPIKTNIFKAAFHQLYKAQINNKKSFGSLLGSAIKDSINSILSIGGFIIIFSVMIGIFSNIGIVNILSDILYICTKFLNIHPTLYKGIASGALEITTGCNKISSLPLVPIHQKIFATAAVITWGGISVHSQTASFISKTDISLTPYIYAKIIQSILAGFYSLLIMPFFNIRSQVITQSVFSVDMHNSTFWDKIAFTSKSFIYVSVLILLVGLIIYINKSISPLKK